MPIYNKKPISLRKGIGFCQQSVASYIDAFFSIGDIMATRLLRINDDFRDSLEETLDRNNCSGKVRPYYCGIPYEDKIILVPLRSRCPRSYSIPIYNTGGRARPGLDFCKMIIIDRSELSQNTSSVTVNGNIVDDLNRKQNQILAMVRQTVRDYKTMKQKVENNMDLSSDEKFLKMRSTLRNWENIIIYWYV